MNPSLRRDSGERGGAMVELAVSMVVIVPLILYSTWFADVAHWKIKLEEASIAPVMDLTAWRVNDFHSPSPNRLGATPQFHQFYDNAVNGVVGNRSVPDAMSTSFDSAEPAAHTFQSSVFVQPRNLQVTCQHFENTKPRDTVNYNSSYDTNQSRPGEGVPEFNLHSWVTCKATARLATAGVPKKFQEMGSMADTNPGQQRWAAFSMCGVGPGIQGCQNSPSAGLSIMLDDWGFWDVDAHENVELPLSLGAYDNVAPDTWVGTAISPPAETSDKNVDYFKMAKRYWRDPDPLRVGQVMNEVAGAEDMGLTDYFHISYRKGAAYNYGDGSNTNELRWGQRDAYGGPNKQSLGGAPHTGGPWHEESQAHFQVSERAFDMRSAAPSDVNRHYLGVPAWPTDGPKDP